jgi:hypothetical protein
MFVIVRKIQLKSNTSRKMLPGHIPSIPSMNATDATSDEDGNLRLEDVGRWFFRWLSTERVYTHTHIYIYCTYNIYDGWMAGWMDGCMYGCMDVWMDACHVMSCDVM